MSPEAKFAVMAACIYLPLGLGYLARKAGCVNPAVSKPLQRINVLTLEVLVAFVGCWTLDLSSPGRALLVPVIGSLVSVGLLGVGFAVSGVMGHTGTRRGAFVVCAMMSNIGMSLGGFVCYMFHGAAGQSLAVAYTSHFLPVCYVVAVAVASYYAVGSRMGTRELLVDMVRNPILVVPIAAMVLGIVMNVAGAAMPGWVMPVNGVAVVVLVSVHSFAIGLTLRLSRVRGYWREVAALTVMKFAVGPLIGVGVVYALGQWGAFDGVLWRVVVIEGAMPVAIFATIVSNLFDLDRDLANTAWVLTTLACAAMLPILYVVTATGP